MGGADSGEIFVFEVDGDLEKIEIERKMIRTNTAIIRVQYVDGKIVSANADKYLTIWSIKGELINNFLVELQVDKILGVGKFCLIFEKFGKQMDVMDLQSQLRRGWLDCEGSVIDAVVFKEKENNNILATCSLEKKLKLWNIEAMKC